MHHASLRRTSLLTNPIPWLPAFLSCLLATTTGGQEKPPTSATEPAAEISHDWAGSDSAHSDSVDGDSVDTATLVPDSTQYIRLTKDQAGEPASLDTAIVRLVPAEGTSRLTVDLVGVIHIADQPYYEKLNDILSKYDVVLYELVAPQGTRVPKGGGGRSDNPISLVQGMAKSVLELASQVEHIDYSPENFVHADQSPDEMGEAMRENGEDGFTLFLNAAAHALRQANLRAAREAEAPAEQNTTELDPFQLLLDPNKGNKLKRFMAEQFAAQENLDDALGPDVHRIVVANRNAAAMKIFQRELASGRQKIAIFYGAAHMPDFEKRLVNDFGLRVDSSQWLTAWDLSADAVPKNASSPFTELLRQFLQESSK